jgi:hypothetical protein
MGYAKHEMYNKMLLDFVHSEDIALTIKSVENIQDVKEVSNTNRYVNKDGTLLTIDWVSRVKGKVIYCVGTLKNTEIINYKS